MNKTFQPYKVMNDWEHLQNLPKKVKVVIISGQSNTEGCSPIDQLSVEEKTIYGVDFDNVAMAYYNFTGPWSTEGKFVNVAFGQGYINTHFGYEVGMAYEFSNKDPENYYCIIKYSRGDTDILENWRSPSSGGKTGYLYTGIIEFVNKCFNELKSQNIEFDLVGFCWMQGERDGSYPPMAETYLSNLENLYKDLHCEWDKYCKSGSLRIIDAHIKDYEGTYKFVDVINNAKDSLAKSEPNHYVIDTNSTGLDLKTKKEDWFHYVPSSELKLGRAFADIVLLK